MFEFIKSAVWDFWSTLGEMSPYLLLGFFVAGLFSVVMSRKLVEKHLGGRGVWPVIKASLMGVPLPLCSCGVIPVSMSLYKSRASKGAVISFLLSTPQTGIDSIFVTFSLLGPVFAIIRPVVAFAAGIIGGTVVDIFAYTSAEKEHTADDANCSCGGKSCHSEAGNDDCNDNCCGGEGAVEEKKSALVRIFEYGFVTMPADIGKPMLLGLAAAAVISVLVPDGFFAEKLGTGITAMLLMMLMGIPVYVCATASVPVAAALMLKGLTPGAALVFLMTGPATNIVSFLTIWKILDGKTAIIYLLTVAGCALGAGLMLDYFSGAIAKDLVGGAAWMLPPALKSASAVLLLLILFRGLIKKHSSAGKNAAK